MKRRTKYNAATFFHFSLWIIELGMIEPKKIANLLGPRGAEQDATRQRRMKALSLFADDVMDESHDWKDVARVDNLTTLLVRCASLARAIGIARMIHRDGRVYLLDDKALWGRPGILGAGEFLFWTNGSVADPQRPRIMESEVRESVPASLNPVDEEFTIEFKPTWDGEALLVTVKSKS